MILFSVLWRPMTRNAAIAGMVSGAITVVVWKQLSGGWFDVYELLPGFIIASLMIYLVTKMDKSNNAEPEALFDSVTMKLGKS